MHFTRSLPSRGAWIETEYLKELSELRRVAPLTGSVDRNTYLARIASTLDLVAPLTGSVDRNRPFVTSRVDRNKSAQAAIQATQVAPLAGSVDRNGKLLPWEAFLADLRTFPAVARSGSSGLP